MNTKRARDQHATIAGALLCNCTLSCQLSAPIQAYRSPLAEHPRLRSSRSSYMIFPVSQHLHNRASDLHRRLELVELHIVEDQLKLGQCCSSVTTCLRRIQYNIRLGHLALKDLGNAHRRPSTLVLGLIFVFAFGIDGHADDRVLQTDSGGFHGTGGEERLACWLAGEMEEDGERSAVHVHQMAMKADSDRLRRREVNRKSRDARD